MWVVRRAHRRSLPFASPDFLWKLVALANSMRLSLKKGAHTNLSRVARQEIRVRFGPTALRGRRDDK